MMISESFSWFYTAIISIAISSFIYQFVFRYRTYFSRNGVKFIRGLPVLGSHWAMVLGRDSMASSFGNIYKQYPNEPFVGMYDLGGSPSYLIRDPELFKKIAIKDFDHFTNHNMTIDRKVDPIMGSTMFAMRDQEWRDMRATLSPAFTSSKMRLMLSLINECAVSFCQIISKEIQVADKDGVMAAKEYNLKDLFARFANDAIATSAFGIQINSLVDRDNEFYRKGLEIGYIGGFRMFKMLGYQMFPTVMNKLRLPMFSHKEMKFFRDLVRGNIKYRNEHHIYRPDMINLLMEAKQGKLLHSSPGKDDQDGTNGIDGYATVQESDVGKSSRKFTDWDDNALTAQCLIFFLAGFNGLAITQSFLAHELAVNPDIQRRLHAECMEAKRKLNGAPLSYEVLGDMKYLDQLLSETLRRWTLSAVNDRQCNKPYTLDTNDGRKVHLNVGDTVWFGIESVHLDAKYFPDPEKFDPDRFSDERKGDIQSGTYVPFGLGPRNCVGSRYALMGVKAIMYHMMVELELVMSARTQHPIKLARKPTVSPEPEKGFWAGLKLRSK